MRNAIYLTIINLALLYFLPICKVSSQEMNVKTGLFGFFDNREYFNYYENDQTIFGTRSYANAGFTINEQSEFYLGVDGLYEFGSLFDPNSIKPILYFHYQGKKINTMLGSFHRNNLINLPNVLLNDTLVYYRPNIEGLYLGYASRQYSHDIWIDWTSRQTMEYKEIFMIGGSGALILNTFFYKHDFIFTHYALTAKGGKNEHIHDNGGIYSRIGIDLSNWSVFDSLTISTGVAFSYDRLRNEYPLRYYKGSITELYIQYHKLGIKYTGYFGSGQKLITGDPLYEAKNYSRFDFLWMIFNQPGLEGTVGLSIHFLNDYIDYSQKFTIRAEFGKSKKLD
jgi:hypothetical protein